MSKPKPDSKSGDRKPGLTWKGLVPDDHVATQKGTPITKDTHRLILSCLHPDRAANDPKMQKRLERAFQAFTAIAYIFPPDQE